MIKVICQCGRSSQFPHKMTGKIWKCSNCGSKTRVASNQLKKQSAPQKIGPYTIISELGRGGMGVVYEVEHIDTGKRYALKVLLSLRGFSEKKLKRFQREAEVLVRLNHPNIVGFVTSGIEKELYYMVTELVKGHSLKVFMKESPTSYQVALALVDKISDALKHAHMQGIIHRDIKPSNIMIDENLDPILLDFGIAKVTNADISITRSGAMIGTPQYMSPEQAEGKKADIDGRSDIYSLGCILYELITGKPAVDHKEIKATIYAVVNETPVLPSTLVLGLPLKIDEICMKALAKKLDVRYHNIAEFQQAIHGQMKESSCSKEEWKKTFSAKSTRVNKPKKVGEDILPIAQSKEQKAFAHYKILEELGRGGMGIVYKALNTKNNNIVALKLILFGQSDGSKEFKRFSKEATIVSSLNHDNITKVLEVGNTPEPYFSMEYIEGETLSSIIKNKKMNLIEMIKIWEKVANTLCEIHKKGIIHRDIKPDNIMVTIDKEPKIMDFGLAKVTDKTSSLTKTGDVLGTPAYMPPEQVGGKNADHRSDIYSLGATLYEILTGKPPFEGSYFEIMGQIFDRDPISPGKINKDIPAKSRIF